MKTKIIAIAAMPLLFAQGEHSVRAQDIRMSCPGCRQQKTPATKIIPAYLNYVPFEWVSFRAVTTRELVEGTHKAIEIGLDKAQRENTYRSVVRVSSPSDIDTLKSLIQNHHNLPEKTFLGEPRLLFEGGSGETQIFVYLGGTASQGTQKWQLSAEDFGKLKQVLHQIYSRPGSYYSKSTL